MIKDQLVNVKITNQAAYFVKFGYPKYKQGTFIDVPWSILPKNSNKKVSCICDECSREFIRDLQTIYSNRIKNGNFDLCYDCARSRIGKKNIGNQWGFTSEKMIGAKHPRWNSNKTEFKKYSTQAHWIAEKIYRKHKNTLNPENLPRTLCGVIGGYQLDHKISLKEGFMKGISVNEISNLNNLQLLPWKENRTKGTGIFKGAH